MAPRLQFLRPYASHLPSVGKPIPCSSYLRLYQLARASRNVECRWKSSSAAGDEEHSPEERSALRAQRLKELGGARGLEYPRLSINGKPTSTREFLAEFDKLPPEKIQSATGQRYCVHGRILHIRRHGSKFSFLTMIHDGVQLQVMVNLRKLLDNTDPETFKKRISLLQRGDHICKPAIVAFVVQYIILISQSLGSCER